MRKSRQINDLCSLIYNFAFPFSLSLSLSHSPPQTTQPSNFVDLTCGFYFKWKMYANMIFKYLLWYTSEKGSAMLFPSFLFSFLSLLFFCLGKITSVAKKMMMKKKKKKKTRKIEKYSNCVPSFRRFNGFAIIKGRRRKWKGVGIRHTLKCYLCIITDYYVDEKIVKKKFTTERTMALKRARLNNSVFKTFSHKTFMLHSESVIVVMVQPRRVRDKFYEFLPPWFLAIWVRASCTWNMCR